jgi:hypothetical protein
LPFSPGWSVASASVSFDHGWGNDFATGIGGKPEAIEKEVMRRVGTKTYPKIVNPAVAGILAKRKPRC